MLNSPAKSGFFPDGKRVFSFQISVFRGAVGGEGDFEQQAAVGSVFYDDGAVVKQYGIFYYRQSETCASCCARPSFVNAVETLEYSWQMFLGDAVAIVGYSDNCFPVICLSQSYGYKITSAICYGVVNQIVEYGFEHSTVALKRHVA